MCMGLMLVSSQCFASITMPWDSGIDSLKSNLTGPIPIPLNIAIHGAVIYVTKQDADVFYCLRSYMQQKRNYNA